MGGLSGKARCDSIHFSARLKASFTRTSSVTYWPNPRSGKKNTKIKKMDFKYFIIAPLLDFAPL